MLNLGSILALATLLAMLLNLGATAVHGIFTGRLFYEPALPPLVFHERPVKFVALITFYLVAAGFLVGGSFQLIRELL
jgi:hypothetical protein